MKPIIVYNSKIAAFVSKVVMPIAACTFWPFIWVNGPKISQRILRHEVIHIKQAEETLVLFGSLFYLFDYGWYRLVKRCSHDIAYKSIRMEREAYDNQNDKEYLLCRSRYAWLKYKLRDVYVSKKKVKK
jgi:hypothetical protein